MFNTIKLNIRSFMAKAESTKNFLNDEAAMAQMGGGKGGVFGKIVGLFIIAILIGSVFVTGLQQLATANMTGLSVTQVAMMAIVGLILVVGVLWLILEYVGLV